jgi:hypothetical protein
MRRRDFALLPLAALVPGSVAQQAQPPEPGLWVAAKVYKQDNFDLVITEERETWLVALTVFDKQLSDAIVEAMYWFPFPAQALIPWHKAESARMLLSQTAAGPVEAGKASVIGSFSVPLKSVSFFRVKLLKGVREVEIRPQKAA